MNKMQKSNKPKRKNVDKIYLARCLNRLKEWGAPLKGWYCKDIWDVREDDSEADLAKCDLCDCHKVRYVHEMENDYYFEPVSVGCICAGIMEENILAAQERERKLRNRSKRRRNFMKRRWEITRRGVHRVRYKNTDFMIIESGDSIAAYAGGKSTRYYKGKPIRDLLSAKYAAYDLYDPVSEVMRS